MAVRRLRKRFVAGGVALVVLVGAGWFVQHHARQRRAEAGGGRAGPDHPAQLRDPDAHPIKTFVTGVAAQKATVSTTMAREIYFSKVLRGSGRPPRPAPVMQSIT